jgi:hypothetical protein
MKKCGRSSKLILNKRRKMTEYYELNISQFQRDNLEKLYAYLENVNEIDMVMFNNIGARPDELYELKDTLCNTVCCLAGNGPLAGIQSFEYETWGQYIQRVFGTELNGNERMMGAGCLAYTGQKLIIQSRVAAKGYVLL